MALSPHIKERRTVEVQNFILWMLLFKMEQKNFEKNDATEGGMPSEGLKIRFFSKSIFLTRFYEFPPHDVFIKVVPREKLDDFDTLMR